MGILPFLGLHDQLLDCWIDKLLLILDVSDTPIKSSEKEYDHFPKHDSTMSPTRQSPRITTSVQQVDFHVNAWWEFEWSAKIIKMLFCQLDFCLRCIFNFI